MMSQWSGTFSIMESRQSSGAWARMCRGGDELLRGGPCRRQLPQAEARVHLRAVFDALLVFFKRGQGSLDVPAGQQGSGDRRKQDSVGRLQLLGEGTLMARSGPRAPRRILAGFSTREGASATGIDEGTLSGIELRKRPQMALSRRCVWFSVGTGADCGSTDIGLGTRPRVRSSTATP
jgi:hypothetical protein